MGEAKQYVMVTECVINAQSVQSLGRSQLQDTFSEIGREKGQQQERGHPGPPYVTASVQREDLSPTGPQANDPCQP